MNSLFNLDNPVFRFFGRVFDIAYLNILFVVSCIPIITIGPAVTALYYCMMKIHRDRDSSITKMFFHSFKENLKQGILLTIFLGAFTLILIVDIKACDIIDGKYMEYIKAFLYVISALLAATASYAFPMLAQFDNKIISILKNALLLSILKFGNTLYIVAFHAIPVVIFLFFPELFLWTFPVWITFGFALIARINSITFVKIFDKFIGGK